MERTEKAVCLVCGGARFRTLASYDAPDAYERAAGVPAEGYHRSWVRCEACGLCASTHSRPPEAFDRLYASSYRSEKAAWRSESTRSTFDRVIALPFAESETKQRVAWIKSEAARLRAAGFLGKSRPPYRLLDIGGATGVFAHEFRDDEWQPHVVDPSEAGGFLESELGIPYRQGLYEPRASGVAFDLVSLVFVLEHLADPVGILEEVKTDLRERGLIYIEVPDAAAFRHKPPDDDIFNSTHLWLFTPETLARLAASCGYQVYGVRRVKVIRGHFAITLLGGLA